MKIVAIEEHVLPEAVRQAWSTLPGGDVQVLSLTTPGLNNLGHHGIDLAPRVNDLLAETVVANPSRFQALTVLPFADGEGAAQELQRCVEQLGCKGAIVYGRVGEKNLDNAMFEPTFACK
ncbi:amidohydrolase family protein [Ralstonia solanacearum]|nr:amidohydrolase family protein [Ralstonia solanacearum]MDB0529639.1 amidohydrolase family protein [Ralstonia solanacearum]